MQDSTVVMAGNSGFFSSFVGTQGSWRLAVGHPVELSWGRLISSRDVQDGSCLVAVMGDCSLVLKRDYSIIVVRVNSAVAGVSVLSNGGVQALLSLWCEVHLY